MPIFRGRQLIGYDFDSECGLIDQMIKDGDLIPDKNHPCEYVLADKQPLKSKINGFFRKFFANISGKTYGCCDKTFVNCNRCIDEKLEHWR